MITLLLLLTNLSYFLCHRQYVEALCLLCSEYKCIVGIGVACTEDSEVLCEYCVLQETRGLSLGHKCSERRVLYVIIVVIFSFDNNCNSILILS